MLTLIVLLLGDLMLAAHGADDVQEVPDHPLHPHPDLILRPRRHPGLGQCGTDSAAHGE